MDKYSVKRLEENVSLTSDEATELATYLKWLEQRNRKLESAIEGIVKEPYGCPMCDSGVLRNKQKEHWDDCPFLIAEKLLNSNEPGAVSSHEEKKRSLSLRKRFIPSGRKVTNEMRNGPGMAANVKALAK